MNDRLYTFTAGPAGTWRIAAVIPVIGEPLASADGLSISAGTGGGADGASWRLRGVTSHERYVTRGEKERLNAKQEGLGRNGATCAALIPIRKSEAWWKLSQDERREILETRSRHIHLGIGYLPAIARRLHHCRDLGTPEPFDFLTWFEFAPRDTSLFDDLVAALRATEEWRYVEREVDIRLLRADA